MFQHMLLGLCGTSPISSGRLVLIIEIWTPDVQMLKVRQNNVKHYHLSTDRIAC